MSRTPLSMISSKAYPTSHSSHPHPSSSSSPSLSPTPLSSLLSPSLSLSSVPRRYPTLTFTFSHPYTSHPLTSSPSSSPSLSLVIPALPLILTSLSQFEQKGEAFSKALAQDDLKAAIENLTPFNVNSHNGRFIHLLAEKGNEETLLEVLALEKSWDFSLGKVALPSPLPSYRLLAPFTPSSLSITLNPHC